MYIGHYAVGFALRSAAAEVDPQDGPSLGTYVMAALLADLLLGAFMLVGLEHVRIAPGITAVVPFDLYDYPWSHSLLMMSVWAALLASAAFLRHRHGAVALLLAATVLSHWVLDVATHRPDMPVGLHGPYVGLGLWNSRWGTAVVEGTIFVAGVAAYGRATHADDRVGRYAFAALVAFLVATTCRCSSRRRRRAATSSRGRTSRHGS